MSALSALGAYFQKKAPQSNAHTITVDRGRCLGEMIRKPTTCTQRFVEELSFVPTGGQRWERTLQIQIPKTANADGPAWWIVPLGPFARRRFPDLQVTNAAGSPVRLLTRRQHGQALTAATVAKPLHRIRKRKENYRDQMTSVKAFASYTRICRLLTEFYTEISDTDSRIEMSKVIVGEYKTLLHILQFADKVIQTKLKRLAADLADVTDTTQYLCWIHAAPGDTIHLQATYTVRDPKHKLEEGSAGDLFKALWIGVVGVRRKTKLELEKARGARTNRTVPLARRLRHYLPFRLNRKERRARQANWFRQYGLAPINYGFNVPTYRYTASYYATLVPPANTSMTYVDWEIDHSFNASETDCAFQSIHVYNAPGDRGRDKTFHTTRAYVRCTPHHHKQILIASLLNVAVVWLLVKGRLPGVRHDVLQGLIVASPSLWVAFLAQQQRHYYAHALRRSRAILWAYLVVGAAFLVAVAANETNSGGISSDHLGSELKIMAWLLAVTSVGICAWHFPLGQSYERTIKYLRNRKWYAIEEPKKLGPFGAFANDLWWVRRKNAKIKTAWRCYESAYERYSRFIWKTTALSMVTMIGVLQFVLKLSP